MGNTSFTHAFTVNSTAGLRAWGADYEAGFVAAGLTKVYSSSSWASVTYTGVAGATWMTEVWQFATPPTGGTTLFMKVVYSARGVSATTPKLEFTVAEDHSGGGVMSSPSIVVDTSTVATAGTSTTFTSLIAGDGHGFVLAHNYTAPAANGNFIIVVDRQRQPDGTATPISGLPNTGAGVLYVAGSGGASRSFSILDPVADTVHSSTASWPVIGSTGTLIASTSRKTAADETAFWPVFLPSRQGGYMSKMVLVYPQADYPLLASPSVTHLGAARTYRTLQAAAVGMDWNNRSGSAVAMWWSD